MTIVIRLQDDTVHFFICDFVHFSDDLLSIELEDKAIVYPLDQIKTFMI